MKARLLQCSEEAYHKDDIGPIPTLSHSIAHILVTQSPVHAYLAHPKLGGQRREMTQAMLEGAILHRLILKAGPDIQIIHADNYRTKAAQALYDHAISIGQLPVLASKFSKLEEAALTLRQKCFESSFPLLGQSEVAVEWDVDGVLCRAKMDHVYISESGVHIYDVKKCRSCNPQDIARTAYQYGLDIQHAAYTEAMRAMHGRQDVDFTFLCCEIEPPYSVVPITLDKHFRRLGMQRWYRACMSWEECLSSGKWPGYEAAEISPPTWVEINEWDEMQEELTA